jgi:transketolase
MRNSVVGRITARARKDESIFFITGDAGFGVLDEFRDELPGRFLNLGVAEQNMISFAAGLGLAGYRVFVYNIVPFVLYRCYEQVRNDICYQRVPVTLIGIGSGVTYAPQGVTHYSLEDIALARTLPNLVILSPADPVEAVRCADYALRSKRPVYIRIAKSGEPVIHKKAVRDVASPIAINEGDGVAVLFHGSVGVEVIQAAEGLRGVRDPLVLSVPMVQPLNFKALRGMLKDVHTIITVEEHYADGGLGSAISEWLMKERLPYRLRKLGMKNEFVHLIKDNRGMRRHYGISADRIMTAIEEAYKGG